MKKYMSALQNVITKIVERVSTILHQQKNKTHTSTTQSNYIKHFFMSYDVALPLMLTLFEFSKTE